MDSCEEVREDGELVRRFSDQKLCFMTCTISPISIYSQAQRLDTATTMNVRLSN
jgi:hypothetical protein